MGHSPIWDFEVPIKILCFLCYRVATRPRNSRTSSNVLEFRKVSSNVLEFRKVSSNVLEFCEVSSNFFYYFSFCKNCSKFL